MRYDRVWSIAVRRVLSQADSDLKAVLDLAQEQGMSDTAIVQQMLRDLDNNGPVFGRMLRGLSGAAVSTVRAAVSQGEVMGFAAQNEALLQSRGLAATKGDVLSAIDRGDAEFGASVEGAAAEVEYTWVATLVNTCHLCLPLHGRSMTLGQWGSLGLHPDTVHQEQGWESSCRCKLVPTATASGRAELQHPLRRAKVPKGGKATVRAVMQADVEEALRLRDEAMKSEKGRATLRRLGSSGKE